MLQYKYLKKNNKNPQLKWRAAPELLQRTSVSGQLLPAKEEGSRACYQRWEIIARQNHNPSWHSHPALQPAGKAAWCQTAGLGEKPPNFPPPHSSKCQNSFPTVLSPHKCAHIGESLGARGGNGARAGQEHHGLSNSISPGLKCLNYCKPCGEELLSKEKLETVL